MFDDIWKGMSDRLSKKSKNTVFFTITGSYYENSLIIPNLIYSGEFFGYLMVIGKLLNTLNMVEK